MKTIRLEISDPPALLAGICRDVNVYEELSCPVGHFRCPFSNTACSSVEAWMWEEMMEETPAKETADGD